MKSYLADIHRTIIEGLSPADHRALPSAVVNFKMGLSESVLRDAELYTFDRSALEMAGSLKIGDPAELHRVLRSVLAGPRRTLFLEADGLERAEALTHLRNTVIKELSNREAIPSRVGILLEIMGDGTARYRPIWNHSGPRSDLRKQAQSKLREGKRNGVKRTPLQEQAFRGIVCLNANAGWKTIALPSKPNYPTMSEFSDMAQRGEGEADRYLQGALAQKQQETFSRPLSDDDFLKIAWWSHCSHKMEQPTFEFEEADQFYIDELKNSGMPHAQIARDMQRNCDGELTNIAAMLSVLAIESKADNNPVVFTDERPAQVQRVRSPRHVKHIRKDRLRVVSHNVSGIETRCRGGARIRQEQRKSSGPRAVHFVNAHMFLARSGQMTWHRAHWRGSEPPAPVLNRVR